jgi:tetratricopeptide (TPR) repeat protein
VKDLPDKAELSVRQEKDNRSHSHQSEQTLLLLVPGTTVGSIIQPRGEAKTGEIRLHPLPDLISGTPITLSETERKAYLLKLTKNVHTGRWEGAWRSLVLGAPENCALVMAFPETSLDLTGEITDPGRRRAAFGLPSRSFSASYPRAPDTTYNGLIYSLHDGQMDVTLRATFQDGGPPDSDIYVPVLMSLNAEAPGLYDAGSNLLEAKKYLEALPKLEAAAKLSPDNHESMNNFAWTLVAIAITTKTPLDPRALEFAKAAVERAPLVANYYDTLAHAEYLSGNLTAARDAWATVYRLQPEYQDTDPLCAKDKQIYEGLKKQGGITK